MKNKNILIKKVDNSGDDPLYNFNLKEEYLNLSQLRISLDQVGIPTKGWNFFIKNAKILENDERNITVLEILDSKGVIELRNSKNKNTTKPSIKLVDPLIFNELIKNEETYNPLITSSKEIVKTQSQNSKGKRLTGLNNIEFLDLLKNKFKANRGLSFNKDGQMIFSKKTIFKINESNLPEDITDYMIEHDNVDYTKFITYSSIKKEIHKTSNMKVEAALSMPYISINSYYEKEEKLKQINNKVTKYEIEKAIMPKGILTDLTYLRGDPINEFYNFFYTNEINEKNLKLFYENFGELLADKILIGGVLYTEESTEETFIGSSQENSDKYGIGTKIEALCVKASVSVQNSNSKKQINELTDINQKINIRNIGGNAVSIFNLVDWIQSVHTDYQTWDIIEILDTKNTLDLLPKIHYSKLKKLSVFLNELQYYSNLVKENPKSHFYIYRNGLALKHLNRYEEAYELFDNLLKIYWSGWYEFEKGYCLGKLKKYREAINCFNKANSSNWATNIDSYLYKAFCHQTLNLNSNEYFKTVLEYPLNYYVHIPFKYKKEEVDSNNRKCRGCALLHMGNFKEAIQEFDEALFLLGNKSCSEILHYKALCYVEINDLNTAITLLDKAYEINPIDQDIIKSLERIELKMKQDKIVNNMLNNSESNYSNGKESDNQAEYTTSSESAGFFNFILSYFFANK